MLLMIRVMHQYIRLLFLLLLMLCNTVMTCQLALAAAPSPTMADRRQPIALYDLLDLLRVRQMIVQSTSDALQLAVFQNATWSTALLVHLLGVVVTAPVLLVVLATVAIVHVPVQHQARRRPGTLDEQQFAAFICGEEKTAENVSKAWIMVITGERERES